MLVLQGMGEGKIPLYCRTIKVFGYTVSEIPTGSEERMSFQTHVPGVTAYW